MSRTDRFKRYLQDQREKEMNKINPREREILENAGHRVSRRVSPTVGRLRGAIAARIPKGRRVIHDGTRKALRRLAGTDIKRRRGK